MYNKSVTHSGKKMNPHCKLIVFSIVIDKSENTRM